MRPPVMPEAATGGWYPPIQIKRRRKNMSVYRCYSKKKEGFDVEAQGLCSQLR